MTEESLLEFPCEFPIKVMGRDTDEFHELVDEVVQMHVDAQDRLDTQKRESRGGRFISVTVRIRARSREQLDAIYRAFTDSRHVLMAL